MKPIEFWEFPIVTKGIERIRVLRDGQIYYDGVVPAGFKMHLTIGDSVTYKLPRQKWRRKFKVVIYRGLPCVRYGTRCKLMPDQYRSVKFALTKKRNNAKPTAG